MFHKKGYLRQLLQENQFIFTIMTCGKVQVPKMNPARPQLVITFKLVNHLLFGILDFGFWGLGLFILGFWDFGILFFRILGLLVFGFQDFWF